MVKLHNFLNDGISAYCEEFPSVDAIVGLYAVGVGTETGLLDELANSIGYWLDGQVGYLEPVLLTADYNYAMDIAQRNNQTCIAKLVNITEVLPLDTFSTALLFAEKVPEGATIIKTPYGYHAVIAEVELIYL